LNIVYADILNFKIFDNNNPLTLGISGCNQGNTRSYPISSLPGGATITGGPYQLYEWVVGNQTFSGVFSDFNELATLMNTLDPNPGWVIENSMNIIGGTPGVSYGPLKATDSQNIPGFSQPSQKSVALGTQMHFATGEHWLIFSKIQTGCADTLFLDIACANCAPIIHPFTPDAAGIIEWAAISCDTDTIFCTNILANDLINWDITDNSVIFDQFANCDNGKVGLILDTGYHEIYLRNRITTCDYRVKFNFDCSGIPVDTLFVTVGVGNTKTLCIDTTVLPGPIVSIENVCPVIIDEQNATLVLDQDNWCVALTGVARGSDLLCIQLCNTAGLCVIVNIAVQVVEAASDNLLIYNAISPNGDGKNDTWHIPDIEQYPNNKVQIFNRWGNLVYQQEGYTNAAGWTGTWQEHPLPDGTYYYVVDLGDGRKLLKGAVVLVR
jgi:gliding motility-associated-like protein